MTVSLVNLFLLDIFILNLYVIIGFIKTLVYKHCSVAHWMFRTVKYCSCLSIKWTLKVLISVKSDPHWRHLNGFCNAWVPIFKWHSKHLQYTTTWHCIMCYTLLCILVRMHLCTNKWFELTSLWTKNVWPHWCLIQPYWCLMSVTLMTYYGDIGVFTYCSSATSLPMSVNDCWCLFITWILRLFLWVKPAPHRRHRKGFWEEWTVMWRLTWHLAKNVFPQMGHVCRRWRVGSVPTVLMSSETIL